MPVSSSTRPAIAPGASRWKSSPVKRLALANRDARHLPAVRGVASEGAAEQDAAGGELVGARRDEADRERAVGVGDVLDVVPAGSGTRRDGTLGRERHARAGERVALGRVDDTLEPARRQDEVELEGLVLGIVSKNSTLFWRPAMSLTTWTLTRCRPGASSSTE